MAVVEAKPEYKTAAEGLQQAKNYAKMLGLHFAYVRFHFCINDAPRKRIPFFLGMAASICTRRSHSSPQMGWPQLVIHMFCVGLPFTLVVRRYANGKS